MVVENAEVSFASRLRHVKQGERRVAEMESHVRNLREKLCRLEKMLPQCHPAKPTKLHCESRPELEYKKESGDAASVCPIDEIAKKEKFLRKQIYDMECTEQDYMRRIADAESEPVNVDEPCKSGRANAGSSFRRNREEIVKDRLCLLDSFSERLGNNLQTLEKNHVDLAEETRRLAQALEETRKNCGKGEATRIAASVRSCTPRTKKSSVECSGGGVSANACSCDKCKSDSRTGDGDDRTKKCRGARKPEVSSRRTPRGQETCESCEETGSSSSGSDGPCDCRKTKYSQSVKKTTRCSCIDVDTESGASDDSSDASERSKYTCFCSRNQSHEELLEADDNVVSSDAPRSENTKIERFRGEVDARRESPASLVVQETQNLSAKLSTILNPIVDHWKVVQVDKLQEGLERLKIRNRNLKDFLYSLENPMNMFNKPSEVFSTTCTEISSSCTIDLVEQSHSGLLSVVKVLEDKCRNKDAIIVALADELKNGASKKLRFRGKELSNDRASVWKSLSKTKKTRRFTKKDSAIGFAVFLLIFVSHVKRSEMISYLSAVKKILTESPFRLISFISESEKISADYFSAIQAGFNAVSKRFMVSAIFSWSVVQTWLGKSFRLTRLGLRSLYAQFSLYSQTIIADFLVPNQLYIASISSLICAVFLIVKFREQLMHHLRTFSARPISQLSSSYESVVRTIQTRLLPSRIFWLIMGYSAHVLWTLISPDILELVYALYPQKEEQPVEQLETSADASFNACELLQQLMDCSWLASIMLAKIQTFVEFTSYVLQSCLSAKTV